MVREGPGEIWLGGGESEVVGFSTEERIASEREDAGADTCAPSVLERDIEMC